MVPVLNFDKTFMRANTFFVFFGHLVFLVGTSYIFVQLIKGSTLAIH